MVVTADKIKVWTYEDYQQLPEYHSVRGQDFQYEILGGELLMTPAPLIQHQRIVLGLGSQLNSYAQNHNLGEVLIAPVDVLLSDINIVQPDIVYVSQARLSIITESNVQGAPDLCVEVVSPFSDRRDRITKFEIYARFGVGFYWIVDSQLRSVEEYRLDNSQYQLVRDWKQIETFAPQLFPNLQINLSSLFPTS